MAVLVPGLCDHLVELPVCAAADGLLPCLVHLPIICASSRQLAVLNIADHFTRVNVGKPAGGPAPRVFGMLFGTQDGRKVDICASVEMLCPPVDGKPTLRRDIFDKSLRLCACACLAQYAFLCLLISACFALGSCAPTLCFRILHLTFFVRCSLFSSHLYASLCRLLQIWRCSPSTSCLDGTPLARTLALGTLNSTDRCVFCVSVSDDLCFSILILGYPVLLYTDLWRWSVVPLPQHWARHTR